MTKYTVELGTAAATVTVELKHSVWPGKDPWTRTAGAMNVFPGSGEFETTDGKIILYSPSGVVAYIEGFQRSRIKVGSTGPGAMVDKSFALADPFGWEVTAIS